MAHYERLLADVRQHTLHKLARRGDEWLYGEWTLGNGQRANNYWAWFHVAEDEISHRGQVLLIRRHLLPRPVGTP